MSTRAYELTSTRIYDPQLGRWHVVDPLAEKYNDWTVFQYCRNNPIRRVDIDGRGDTDKVKKDKEIADKARNANESMSKAFSGSKVALEANIYKFKFSPSLGNIKAKVEVGAAKVELNSNKIGIVNAQGSVGFINSSISSKSNNLNAGFTYKMLDYNVKLNGTNAGETTRNTNSKEVFIGSGNTNAKINSDSEYGFSSTFGPLVIDLMINIEAMSNSIVQTINFFDSAGAFDSLRPQTSPPKK